MSNLPTLLLILTFVSGSCGSSFLKGYYLPPSPITNLLNQKSECQTAADSRLGICLPKAACVASGGSIGGTCNVIGACCIYQGTCKSVVKANETYFVSPAYPAVRSQRLDPPICIFTLQRNSIINKFPVCQIRLDFEEFTLAPPINGTCGGQTDSFIISGATNFNQSGLPSTGLCGELTGQHMYLDVDPDKPEEPLLLIVNTQNEQRYHRKWSLRVQQVPCHSPFRAPAGCLQYFTTLSGTVESLNYRGTGRPLVNPNVLISGPQGSFLQPGITPIGFGSGITTYQSTFTSPNYFSDMNYGVCIAKQARMCAIKWDAVTMDFGGRLASQSGTDALNSDGCSSSLNANQDGDYILIPGASRDGRSRLRNRFCGQRFNPEPNQADNVQVVSYVKPFMMVVHTDQMAAADLKNQRGFQLRYSQVPCTSYTNNH